MYLYLKKNEATEIIIPAIDTADHDAFKSGISPVDTAYYKDGTGAWTSLAITDTFAEISTIGVYEISLTAAEMNHDWIMIKVSVSGMSDTAIVIKTYTSDIDDVYSDVEAILTDTNELQTNQGGWATAIGFSVPNEYDTVIAALQTDLDNPSQYKATGFSTHSAADVKAAIEAAGSSIAAILADTNELQTNQGAWLTADVSALALEASLNDIKGTGFVKDTHSLPQCITATGFANATVCTEARLAELDAANLPTDIKKHDNKITGLVI